MKTGFQPALSMKSNPPRVLNIHKTDKNQDMIIDHLLAILDNMERHQNFLFEIWKECLIDKLFIKSPLYANDILITVQKAKDEFNEKKRMIFASYHTAIAIQKL